MCLLSFRTCHALCRSLHPGPVSDFSRSDCLRARPLATQRYESARLVFSSSPLAEEFFLLSDLRVLFELRSRTRSRRATPLSVPEAGTYRALLAPCLPCFGRAGQLVTHESALFFFIAIQIWRGSFLLFIASLLIPGHRFLFIPDRARHSQPACVHARGYRLRPLAAVSKDTKASFCLQNAGRCNGVQPSLGSQSPLSRTALID